MIATSSMKRHLLLLSLAALPFIMTSCVVGPPSPLGMATPGLGGSNQKDAEREAFDKGYMMGRKDARAGRKSNYGLYNTMYNSSTKSAFYRGYTSGYQKFSR
jgi:hypothetical protein